VFLIAAIVVERGSLRSVFRRYRLTILLYAAPLGLAAGLGPTRMLGYYSNVTSLGLKPVALSHWLGTDALLLAYAAGFALVPGAVAGLTAALWRPRSRDESAFAALGLGVLLAIFAEATLYATNGSDRFQERYLMVLLPLVFPAFWIWIQRGRPGARLVAVGALSLIALAARVPLSGYTISDAKQDSPFLLAVFRLEKAVSIGSGSLLVALVASGLACLAVAVCFWPVFARVAVIATLCAAVAASIGAVSFDSHVVRGVRSTLVAPDARWIDHSGLRDVTLVQTPATPHAAAHEQLFWNRSLKRVYFLDSASAIDAFGWSRAHAAQDGRLVSGSKTLSGPLLISQYAVRTQLAGAVRVARGAGFSLWKPAGTPRFALFTGGLYQDEWLSQSGHVTVYPARDGYVRGVLHLPLFLPPRPRSERTVVQLRAPGVIRRVVVLPGRKAELTFPVSHKGPWTLDFHTDRPGYLGDGRPVSVMAKTPSFSGTYAGS